MRIWSTALNGWVDGWVATQLGWVATWPPANLGEVGARHGVRECLSPNGCSAGPPGPSAWVGSHRPPARQSGWVATQPDWVGGHPAEGTGGRPARLNKWWSLSWPLHLFP